MAAAGGGAPSGRLAWREARLQFPRPAAQTSGKQKHMSESEELWSGSVWHSARSGARLRVHFQSSSCESSATPRRIQWSACADDGRCSCVTKFVLCPVVDSVPARREVL